MISIIIDVLISKRDKMPFKEKILLIFLVILIATPLVFLLVFFIDANQVQWAFFSAITAVAIPIVLFLLERNRIKSAMDNYIDYNNKLNLLRDVLKGLTYDNNGTHGNWYSKRKIKHLINECNKILDESSSPKSKTMDFLKSMILPILSFVAGVIADKASIEISLSLAVAAFVFALAIWGIIQIVEFLGDVILKSSSISTIKSIRDKLKDLLAIDFEDEGESPIEI